MSDEFLPESRMRERKTVVGENGKSYVQLFCANCGRKGGLVPEEHITFAFYLCQPCADKFGNDAHFYQEPDEVFWERVRNAQLEENNGKFFTAGELAIELDDSTSTMAKLASEWQTLVKRTER
jgi:hypothetical protein